MPKIVKTPTAGNPNATTSTAAAQTEGAYATPVTGRRKSEGGK